MSFKKHDPEIEMFDHESVFNFKSLTILPQHELLWKANLRIDEGKNTGERLYWKKVMVMNISSEDPGMLQFKYIYAEESF